jgi:hypothetical protein
MRFRVIKELVRRVWFFPLVVGMLVILLTTLRVHGSSIGMYNHFFYGIDHRDPDLLFGEPRSIRSDEWLVVTPMVISQARQGYPSINRAIGDGENMSVILDVPVWDWTLPFRPQNWSFFLLPLEYAFSLKWWLLGALLVVGCYWFAVTVLPRRHLFAAIVSSALFFMPYVQWWYTTITILSLAYGFIILTIISKLFMATSRRYRFLWTALLAYAGSCFALLQYPPFQLPVAAIVGAFAVGAILDKNYNKQYNLARILWCVAAAAGLVVTLLGVYAATHWQDLQIIAQTDYPGKREVEQLQLTPWHILGGFLAGQLQNITNASNYISNQSESSNFILLAPYLLLPGTYLLYRYFRKGRRRYTLLLVGLLLLLFMIRATIEVTGDGLLALAARAVQNKRILLGVGFAGIVYMVILAREQAQFSYHRHFVKASTLLVLFATLLIGWRIKETYPGYIVMTAKIIGLGSLPALAYATFIKKHLTVSAAVILILAAYSSYRVNPVYRGLGPLSRTPLAEKVIAINSERPERWIVLDSLEFNTYLPAQGIRTVSGVYTYPQHDLWRQHDPNGDYRTVYNRYAQAVFSDYTPDKFYLVQNDMFHVKFNACDPFVQENSQYILSVHPTASPCLELLDTVSLPKMTFYIYQITN